MATVADKIAFAKKYIRNKEGTKFSLTGRDWVRDRFWLPAEGFKLWRKEDATPCPTCAKKIGDVVEHPDDNKTRRCKKCKGLDAVPIIVTVTNLQRQDGKTFSTMAFALATLFLSRNKSIAFLAASEDQAKKLFEENYKKAIEQSPRLASRCKVRGMTIEVPGTGSTFEALAASHRSTTGRTRTHVLIDEARDVEARVAVALMPAIMAMHGIECPNGHVHLHSEQAARAPKKCTACGSRLVPWFGRIMIATASGVLDGSERDWCHDLIESQEQEPSAHCYIFRSETAVNPTKSTMIVDGLAEMFGRVEATKGYMEVEAGNQWTQKGGDVVSRTDIDRCIDAQLVNGPTSDPCVGFLDTSSTVEKTSLVILADDMQADGKPWEFVYVARLDFWLPAEQQSKVIDQGLIEAHLDLVVPMYPALRSLHIDTRGSPWATSLVQNIKTSRRPWSALAHSWGKGGADEGHAGWGALVQHILKGTIRMQESKPMRDEFKGLKTQNVSGRVAVVDKNRAKSHKDITESMAMCCWFAIQDALKPRRQFASRMSVADAARGKRKSIVSGFRGGFRF